MGHIQLQLIFYYLFFSQLKTTSILIAGTEIIQSENKGIAEDINLDFKSNEIDNTNGNFEVLQKNDIKTLLICEASGSSHSEITEHFNINKDIVSQNASCGSSRNTENEKENICNQDLDKIEKTTYIVETSVYKRKCNADSFYLHELLQKSCIGKGIIKDYERNSILSKKSRSSLVSLIINHFLDESM